MVLTIDIGTTTCKAAVFDASGGRRASAHVSLDLVSDGDGAQETDPRCWAEALASLCRELCADRRVAAIVVSGNGPTLVPVFGPPAREGFFVYAQADMARLWLDRRAVVEAKEISRLEGSFVDSSFFLPKVLHLYRTNRPVYDRARWFLSSFEYVNYLLTGEAKAVLHAEDALRWYWSDDLLNALELDREKFPPFCRPGELIGAVTALAAETLGLPKGTPVYAGGPDFLVSILGCGAVEPGRVCDRSGTSEGINLCTREPLGDDRLMTYLHPVKPYHNVSGIISTSGKAIGWIKQTLGMGNLSFPGMYDRMAQAKAGCGGVVFLPYLHGERAPIWDSDAKGVFSGLTLSTGPAELLRSVAEGVCLAVRDVITVMEDLGGEVDELRVTGGPSESGFLNQLKADVTGRVVLIPEIGDAELVGSMVVARTALGDFESFSQAAEDLVTISRRFDPDPSLAAMYAELFVRYRSVYASLKDGWRKKG